MLNQSSIQQNQAMREALDRQMQEFLAKGGKIKEVPGYQKPASKAPSPPSFMVIAHERTSAAKRIRRMLQLSGLTVQKLALFTGLPVERLEALMEDRITCTQHCVESIAAALQAARLNPVPV
jgi:hypothetical protein